MAKLKVFILLHCVRLFNIVVLYIYKVASISNIAASALLTTPETLTKKPGKLKKSVAIFKAKTLMQPATENGQKVYIYIYIYIYINIKRSIK